MIGAVVGVQPFGGEGLSGTGPKPAVRTTCSASPSSARCTVNTAAAGGNAALLAQGDPAPNALAFDLHAELAYARQRRELCHAHLDRGRAEFVEHELARCFGKAFDERMWIARGQRLDPR